MGSCSGQRHLLTAPIPPIGPSVAPCLWWCASQPSPWAELCVEASPALPGDGHPVTRPSRAMSCRSAEIHGGALLRSRRFSTSLDTRASSRVIRPEKSGVSSRPSRKGMCVCAFEHWLQMSIYIYIYICIYIYMYIYIYVFSKMVWNLHTEGIKTQSVLKVLRLAPMANQPGNLTSIQNDLRRVAGKPSQLSSIPATASRFLPSPAV